MILIKFRHWLFGHPNVKDIQEEYSVAEDLIAGTGLIVMSGWCSGCKCRVYWNVDNV